MQNQTTRIAILLAAGVALAAAVTWLLGWFAAVAITPEMANTLRGSPIRSTLYFGVAMNIAPALALGAVAGIALKAATGATATQVGLFVAFPWLVYATLGLLFAPFPPEVSALERLRPLLSWQVWAPVLAVPLGLWVGARLQSLGPWHSRGKGSAA